jgi:hypothetical protein
VGAAAVAVAVAAAAAVAVAAVKAKTAFPLRLSPLVPTAESWGPRPVRRLSRGGIGILSEPPVSRFCSRVHPS